MQQSVVPFSAETNDELKLLDSFIVSFTMGNRMHLACARTT